MAGAAPTALSSGQLAPRWFTSPQLSKRWAVSEAAVKEWATSAGVKTRPLAPGGIWLIDGAAAANAEIQGTNPQ